MFDHYEVRLFERMHILIYCIDDIGNVWSNNTLVLQGSHNTSIMSDILKLHIIQEGLTLDWFGIGVGLVFCMFILWRMSVIYLC